MAGLLDENIPADLKEAFQLWMDNMDDAQVTRKLLTKIKGLPSCGHRAVLWRPQAVLETLLDNADVLVKKSVWIIGGDGWHTTSATAD